MHLEVEAKYEADADVQLQDLVELVESVLAHEGASRADGPSWAEGDSRRERLRATYFDTAELDLTSAGLTLRRRTGGSDAGWHLKVRGADRSRSEIRLPPGRGASRVPARLVTMTYAVTQGRELVPVVQIDTDRTVQRLVDGTGQVLLEVADDLVKARHLPPADGPGDLAPSTSWREIEVELVDGPPSLLDALDPALRASGLAPARSASKLARALDRTPATRAGRSRASGPPTTATGKVSRKTARAGEIALAHVTAQVDSIRAQDLPVRLDVPDAVHAMRVASRRLRSALTTFAPLFDPAVAGPVRGELKWLAGVLGAARDAEVMRVRVTAAVEEERSDARLDDSVPDDVGGELDNAYRAAHGEVLTQLDGERYRALLDALLALTEHPPLTDRARRPARKVLPRLVAKSDARVRSSMRAAHTTHDPVRREERLHSARKAAKQARYSAESVAPVFGKDARDFALAMEKVQESLGDHLDSLNTRTLLHELASRTSRPSTAFTYGRLHALEDKHAERSRARVDEAWAAARKRRLRTWLR